MANGLRAFWIFWTKARVLPKSNICIRPRRLTVPRAEFSRVIWRLYTAVKEEYNDVKERPTKLCAQKTFNIFAGYTVKEMKLFVLQLALALFFLYPTQTTSAEDAAPPGFWEPKQRQSRPDLSALARLRFLTTVDFFPFNYLDAENRLSGLHVDLAFALNTFDNISLLCFKVSQFEMFV